MRGVSAMVVGLLVAGRSAAAPPPVPSFAESKDAVVSFDATRMLLAGKKKAGDAWSIWEMPVQGGEARRISAGEADCVHPYYLPRQKAIFACKAADGYQIELVGLDGSGRERLTYGPGDHLPAGVLRDGRVLFTGPHPAHGSDIYTMYSDGTGVETVRCDHTAARHSPVELASGDIVFESNGKLGRFTSARAVQVEVELPLKRPSGRVEPPYHPSSRGDRDGANLLCLSVYTTKDAPIAAGSVAKVRVHSLNEAGAAVVLGEAPVEPDGSFYVQTPTERPLRFELLDIVGKTIRAEKGWFWTRRGEQRVCVGCHAGPERAPDNVVPQVLLRTQEPVRLGGK